MQNFCLVSWTFFRARYKLPWPVWGGINFPRWLLMEVFQVLTGFTKWDTGKMNWKYPFSCVRYWPVTHIHTKSSQWWCTKTMPVLGFSGALYTTAWKPAFETPWAPWVRLLHFYCIIALSLPHKKWDVRVQNCWWRACTSIGAFDIRVSLCCGSAEKASAFTEKRINDTTIGFGHKCEALFVLLLLEVKRKAQFLIERWHFISVLWSRWKTKRKTGLYLNHSISPNCVGLVCI